MIFKHNIDSLLKIKNLIKLTQIPKKCFNTTKIKKQSYYLLLPEIPNDTADTNPLLRNEEIPSYRQILPDHITTGLMKLAVNLEEELDSLITKSKINEKTKFDNLYFDEIFLPLEKSLIAIESGIRTSKHMAYIYPYSKYMTNFINAQKCSQMSKNERWLNKGFYAILENFNSNIHLLNDKQKKIVNKSIENCKFNGIMLPQNEFERLQYLNTKINEQQNLFKVKVIHATNKFKLVLNDKNQVSELPSHTQKLISANKTNNCGPYIVSLKDHVFNSFMKYCSNRDLRKHLYDAYYSRASYLEEAPTSNNSETIKNLINYRNKKAELLGFKNYGEFILHSSSARTVGNVIDMIEIIRTKLKPIADEEIHKLQQFYSSNGNKDELKPYDVSFWKQKQIEHLYGNKNEITKFEFKLVINGLFEFCKTFFGLEFQLKEIDSSKLWHKDVIVYDIYEEKKHISTLLIDPYKRENKINNIWSYGGRNYSEKANIKSLVYLNLNIDKIGNNSVMDYGQLKQFLYEFGKVLQILLTQNEYSELSDLGFESDAGSITSKLLQRLIYIPQIVEKFSNKKNELELFQTLRKIDRHMHTFELMQKAYLSAFDLECHISKKFWVDIMEELWPKFLSLKISERNFFPCQLTQIFGVNFGSSYYSDIWSEMLAADVFEAFNEIGFEDTEKVSAAFRRFRRVFYQNDVSSSTAECFLRFRGRNPSVDPFIKFYTEK